MDRREFFDTILAPVGYMSIRGVHADKKKKDEYRPISRYFADYDGMDEFIQEIQMQGLEPYFTCATFKDSSTKAIGANIRALKSFYIDIDCGPTKEYKNQREGLEALRSFCKRTGLPRPIIVSSGNGLHVYWALDRALEYNEWKKIGVTLKQKTFELDFAVDPSVTGEGARILRVPDTFNTKDPENPKPVFVLQDAPIITVEDFTRCIPPVLDSLDMVRAPLDAMTRNLMGKQKPSKFAKIMRLSAKTVPIKESVKTITHDREGNEDITYKTKVVEKCAGCPQMLYAYEQRHTLEEPLWWAAVSIAQSCVDRDEAILKLSEGHPGFNPDEAYAKGDHSKGPRTCKEYKLLKPDLCTGCVHKDKITSPIQLGSFTELAKAEDSVIEDVWHEGLKKVTTIEAPTTYPFPWVRAKNGGVAYIGMLPVKDKDKKKDEEALESPADEDNVKLVYDYDIWVKERIEDHNWGAMVRLVLVLPQDGVQEFNVPLEYIAKKEKCQEVFAKHHMTVLGHSTALLQSYIMAWVKMLGAQGKYIQARAQFGWHENNNCCLIGNREIRNTGEIVFSPSSSLTEEVAPLYDTRGSLEAWRAIANTYGKEGNEVRAFCLFAGFGTPLYNFLNIGSMTIHLTNSASGVGKSTIQRMVASIFGHPTFTMLNSHDTKGSKQHRFGVLRHFPLLIDEITNMSGEELSEFAFALSQNRGRNRLQSQINAERKNESTWNTICFTSGNNSLYDTLKEFRASVEGEMYRILELTVGKDTSMTKEEADRVYDQALPENYGVVGELFLLYVAANLDTVRSRLLEVQREFDALSGFESKERFFSACCAATFTGAEIAVKLGLIDIDIERVKQWAIKTIGGVQHTVKTESADVSTSILGDFLNEHHRNTLVVNGGAAQSPTGMKLNERAIKDVAGDLVVRVETDTNMMYISKKALGNWCALRRITTKSFVNNLHKEGILVHESFRKVLSENTDVVGAPVWTLVVDTSKLDALPTGI